MRWQTPLVSRDQETEKNNGENRMVEAGIVEAETKSSCIIIKCSRSVESGRLMLAPWDLQYESSCTVF